MRTPSIERAERLYSARLHVPDHPAILRWRAEESARQRAALRGMLDVPYGDGEAQRLDIFPAADARGVLVFIHGGYWRAQDKRDYAFMVPQLVANGITVILPNYSLCPAVTVQAIVREMIRAIAWTALQAPREIGPTSRLCVGGISAGGHLAAMMAAVKWSWVDDALRDDLVRGTVCVSGLYDLRPLVEVPSINSATRMTRASAWHCSPVRYRPASAAPVHLFVGEDENAGFKSQARLLHRAWRPAAREVREVQGRHHFDILMEYGDVRSTLYATTASLFD